MRSGLRCGVVLSAAVLALGVVRGPARALRPAETAAATLETDRSTLRVLQFGDSHSGSAALHALMRDGLGSDGGPGLVFPWSPGAGDVRAGHTPGWQKLSSKPSARDETPAVGLTGQALETRRAGERAWIDARFRRLRVYLLRQPGGGGVRVRVDGRLIGRVELQAAAFDVQVLAWNAPDVATRHVEIGADGGGAVRVLGVAFEHGHGVTYSPLWVNGAQADWLLRLPEALLAGLLRGEAPAVLVLAFGTNEACDSNFDAAAYEAGLMRVLGRLRAAAPQAALVLVAPPDAGSTKADPLALLHVADVQRRLAASWQAAFVDLRAAMGGAGAIARWQQTGLARSDEVHFTPDGYRELGRHVLAATLDGLGRPRPAEAAAPARVAAGGLRSAPRPRTGAAIYLFRTSDGRFIMTDDPGRVAGESGAWVGAQPE